MAAFDVGFVPGCSAVASFAVKPTRTMERPTIARTRFEAFEKRTDLPLAFLALLVVPALLLEERSTSGWLHQVASGVNWFVWLAFCAEYLGKLMLAPSRAAYVRAAWFDILIIVLSPPFLVPEAMQGVRAVRMLRLLRLVRAMAVAAIGLREAGQALRHRKFHFVALATVAVICVGALGIFVAERGRNPNILTVGDALWWSVVTATTVGYGDVSPTTGEGRLIAVGLMIVGIGFIGAFTATITSYFLDTSTLVEPENSVEARLVRIEEKLDRLTHDRNSEKT